MSESEDPTLKQIMEDMKNDPIAKRLHDFIGDVMCGSAWDERRHLMFHIARYVNYATDRLIDSKGGLYESKVTGACEQCGTNGLLHAKHETIAPRLEPKVNSMDEKRFREIIAKMTNDFAERHGSEMADAFTYMALTGKPCRIHMEWDDEKDELKLKCLDRLSTNKPRLEP